jgi:regulator of sigma E protease
LSGFISALIIIVILGVLITVHELGHYLAARLCGIRVREFAIGMGPVFYKRQKKNDQGEPEGTKFSLRVFPIGGFCDLAEDEGADEGDPAHFRNKTIWQKIFVLASGSLMNVLIGFIFFLALYLSLPFLPVPGVVGLSEEFPYSAQIQAGDRFHSINGRRVYANDVEFFLKRDSGVHTFVMERNGELFTVEGVERTIPVPDTDKDGNEIIRYTFGFNRLGGAEERTFTRAVSHAANSCVSYVRLVWLSLGDIITGKVGAGEIMGPVGMGGVVNDVITEERFTFGDRVQIILELAGLVAVNLAVVNMLPIPALDGGRIIFLFISVFLMLVRKKPLNEKIEGYIHGVTMLLLFGLMFLIFFNDIRNIVTGAFGS